MDPQPAPVTAAPQPDISKQTLIMLVALSCIISVIGVIAMVYEISSTQAAQVTYVNGGQASAQAGFTIGNPHPTVAPPPGVSGTGLVTFRIGE